jgi:site-specific DNA-cytosine methylase
VSPKKARPLTTDERARIQTFPKAFHWLGTKTNREQLVGNAVPVKLAEFVARCVLDYGSGIGYILQIVRHFGIDRQEVRALLS